jgi:hypothetical protein
MEDLDLLDAREAGGTGRRSRGWASRINEMTQPLKRLNGSAVEARKIPRLAPLS